jgi:hypothetical protein
MSAPVGFTAAGPLDVVLALAPGASLVLEEDAEFEHGHMAGCGGAMQFDDTTAKRITPARPSICQSIVVSLSETKTTRQDKAKSKVEVDRMQRPVNFIDEP